VSVNTLERRDDGSYAVRGELTFATVPGFLTGNGRLLAGGAAVTVDLAGVDRADSAGVALLVEWLSLDVGGVGYVC
jgi:phospholipid transport system transporter-binding protein